MPEEWFHKRTVEVVRVRLSEEVMAARKERVKKRICLACGEPIKDGSPVTRGNHRDCYSAQWRQVDDGKESWEELVKQGKVLPPGTPGRKPTNPVTVEYASR